MKEKIAGSVILTLGIAAIALAVWLAFAIMSDRISVDDLTEAEITHIDSVRTLIENAPERSIIDFDQRKMEVITHISERDILSHELGRTGFSANAVRHFGYLLDVATVSYPGSADYDSLAVELVKGN